MAFTDTYTCSLPSDIIHNLMLALAWIRVVREDHLDILPSRVGIDPLYDVEFNVLRQVGHEPCPGCDHIRIPFFINVLWGNLMAQIRHLLHQPTPQKEGTIPYKNGGYVSYKAMGGVGLKPSD